jgi:hypothetical protein
VLGPRRTSNHLAVDRGGQACRRKSRGQTIGAAATGSLEYRHTIGHDPAGTGASPEPTDPYRESAAPQRSTTMNPKKGTHLKRAFVIAFLVLTSLCWCPWAYGTVTGRVLSIPTWAVLAYVFAAALFVLEWVFLFLTGLAVGDDDLSAIVSDLEAAGADDSAAAKEAD